VKKPVLPQGPGAEGLEDSNKGCVVSGNICCLQLIPSENPIAYLTRGVFKAEKEDER
jgi:hypothetical protein